MPKGERSEVRMTASEVREMLATGHIMSLATIGPDGWPHLTAMWFALVDGSVVFMTHRGSQKHQNLTRDNRVVGLVEAGSVYDELRGVQFRGMANEIVDEAGRLRLAAAVTAKYENDLPPDLGHRIRRRAVYAVTLLSHASWDHRKLGTG